MPGCASHASVLSVREDYGRNEWAVGQGEDGRFWEGATEPLMLGSLVATMEAVNPGRSVRGVTIVPL